VLLLNYDNDAHDSSNLTKPPIPRLAAGSSPRDANLRLVKSYVALLELTTDQHTRSLQ